ncbi:hypothetical protein B5807_06739 [Epicoccum nigrum]|uniref:PNPLA domain-containing protein n=1 Tax=Epicoccum nigrum TaxID=105696 RepID=A0A1Y2LZG8_EPING|nr:hypothetical protein B5807_06739 [Epicoccum nigrum]
MAGEANPIDKTGLCLLSLDGGGVRGLSTLYILKGLMQRLNHERQNEGLPAVKPCEIFDLIGGTSTGGLIAIMLGRLEMTVEACIVAYEELMKAVFETKSSWLPISWSAQTKAQFDSGKLRNAIEKVIIDNGESAEELFNDGRERSCRVFVCAMAYETTGITRLRSYPLQGKSNVLATICEAALATSAATGYFDPVHIKSRRFEDGALGANNPAEEVEREAADIWCSESRGLQPLVKCFVSVGTGNPGKNAVEDNMLKFLSRTLPALATETERTEARMIERWAPQFTGKRFFRLNVDQGLQDVGLAEYKEQGKIEVATEEYLNHIRQIVSVRDCVLNLKEKQNETSLAFEAAMQDFNLRMVRFQSQPRVFHNIPFPRNTRFRGRDDHLRILQSMMLDGHGGQKIAITGLGGIGKTQIVLELAYRMQAETPDCSIFWIPAINKEGLEQVYSEIIQRLEIPGYDDEKADSKVLLQRYLSQENPGRWLLIFDNADDIDMWLGHDGEHKCLVDRLPRSDGGRIIFTTRDKKTAVKLASSQIVTVLEADEDMAEELLNAYLIQEEHSNDRAASQRFLRELSFLPLAIVQAASYINENGITLMEYLDLFGRQENAMELLTKDFEDEGRYRELKSPVARTWLISFEKVQARDPLASDYLSFIACIGPAAVPQSLLPPGQSSVLETEAVGLLVAYSFITRRETRTTIDVHPLVRLATQNWLRQQNKLGEWITRVMGRLESIFSAPDVYSQLWRACLPHGQHVLQHLSSNDWTGALELRESFSQCLVLDGRYDDAVESIQKAQNMRIDMQGEHDEENLKNKVSLACIYKKQRRWGMAEKAEREVMAITKDIFGEDHEDTLYSMDRLSIILRNQKRWAETEALELELIRLRAEKHGMTHVDTQQNRECLIVALKEQRKWNEAEQVILSLLKERRQTLRHDHMDIFQARKDLAQIYCDQGRCQDAEDIARELMMTRLESYEDVILILKALVKLYWDQKLWLKAEEILLWIIETTKDDKEKEESTTRLTRLYHIQEHWDKAAHILQQLEKAQKKALGDDHKDVLQTISRLATSIESKSSGLSLKQCFNSC